MKLNLVNGCGQSALVSAVERFGRVDVLCHLAGGFRMGEAVHETNGDTWDFLFDINARTMVNVAHAVVPYMIEGSVAITRLRRVSAEAGRSAQNASE